MRWWLPPAILGGLVVLVIVVGVVLIATQDISEFKTLLTEKVEDSTGRKLVINGEFDLSFSFSPALVAEDVTFENAAWGSEPQMLKLKRLEAKVALLPLIGGRTEIKRLRLVDAEILLETNEEGVSNLEFDTVEEDGSAPKPAEDEEKGGLPLIESAEIVNAVVTFRDGQTGTERRIVVDRVDGRSEGEGEPLLFELEGQIDEARVVAEASVGQGRTDVPVTVEGEIAGAEVTVEGVIGDMETFTGLDLTLSAEGESLADLAALGLTGLPDAGPFALSGRLQSAGEAYTIRDMAGRVGESDVAGTLTFTPGERPRIDGALASQRLDLDALFGQAEPGGADDGDSGGGGAAADGGGRIFSDEPIAFDGLDAADATIKVDAAEVLYSGLTMNDLALTVALENGRLAIEPLTARLAGGTIGAALGLDSRADPPRLSTDLKLAGIDLDALRSVVDLSEVASGPLDADIVLAGRGRSAHQLASTLDGHIELIVGQGRLHSEYIDLIATDLFRFVLPELADADVAALNCFVARFVVEDGLATNNALLLDTELTTTAGNGWIDLGAETAELTIVPRPKDESLISLAIPVVVHGPVQDLGYDLKKEDALMTAAGAVLGTALLGPFGIIIPFVSTGTGEENACVHALAQPVDEAIPVYQGAGAAIVEQLGETAGDVGEGLGDAADTAGEAIGDAAGEAGEALEDVGDAIGDALDDLF